MKSGIYKIEHIDSGKVYIGSSIDVYNRLRCHKRDLSKRKHFNSYLKHAVIKHSIDAFSFEVLLFCAEEHLIFFEQRAIDVYHASESEYGYNKRPVAESVRGMVFDRGAYKAGDKYGRLTFIERHEKVPYKIKWLCRCDCGKEVIVCSGSVKKGSTSSCGCRAKETQTANQTTHGMRFTKEYLTWCLMRSRCYNPKNNRYSTYGAKGITVCADWESDFARFYADMGKCPEGLILGRKNIAGNYDKNNCFWATNAEQIRKRPNAHFVNILGVNYNVRDAETYLGIHRSSINQRHRQTRESYQQVTDHFFHKHQLRQVRDCKSLISDTLTKLAA